MAIKDLGTLPNFEELSADLESERRTIIKINNFSEEEGYVRSLDDAQVILTFLEHTLTPLWDIFKEYPSLLMFFTEEYISFNTMIKRENLMDLIFLDDCLIPEKEMFIYGQDGGINPQVLDIHRAGLIRWLRDKKDKHILTQDFIKTGDVLSSKHSELKCQCTKCSADFRAKVRDVIFDDSIQIVNSAEDEIFENVNSGVAVVSDIYTKMQKDLDKNFYRVRYKLKRSSLNRLENQLKGIIKEKFCFPSELAVSHRANLQFVFDDFLQRNEYSLDLIEGPEYEKFLQSLATNIWRNERYLEREFKKFVKSIIVLKKKDVSSTILQQYLGEFWVHSKAREIKRKFVYHMGPTNSGKTYHAVEKLSKVPKGCYLAPLRLLAAELYDTLNQKGAVTNLLTGEEVIEKEGATHYSSTIEMARLQEYFDCCVIDEIQMITDPSRGWAWTRALVNIYADEIHLCGDPSALELVKVIVELCGDELVVNEYTRMTELTVQPNKIVLADMKKNDALIVFSRKNALRYKRDLERIGYKVSIVYGRLSPEVRREQARKFDEGETDVIVSTDAIAMGMNLPIKRVVFSTLTKYYNAQEHDITFSEIKQIAGRAGRYQRFPEGKVTCLTKVDQGIERVNEALTAELEQSEQCMVGPDLDIFNQVNQALEDNNLPKLKLSEFLRLFNTMIFKKPFFCVDMKEMIEVTEMVEDADSQGVLLDSEIFGFACAPVNLGLLQHVQYFMWILNKYVAAEGIANEPIDYDSSDIDYLETSIKCVELFQWLSRHFDNKNFVYDEYSLLNNKQLAIDKLNTLLSDKIVPTCSSCGCKLPEDARFPICEECFSKRKAQRRGPRGGGRYDKSKDGTKKSRGGSRNHRGQGAKKKVSRKRKLVKK